MRVERLRRDTVRIEEERDSLLSTLDSVKHSELLSDITECDKEDITRYADRILARAMTVEVAVRTDRDPQQEEALHQVTIDITMASNYATLYLILPFIELLWLKARDLCCFVAH
ncbi:BAG family molecular chaperone regulator 2 [Papilio machaon]|uniref:BAG family molecular chaperone regulator 2 n=1 Tax=Papilio machaon TaxID=76193 RepID=A0A0N1ICP5_PAPMA|nr:BAG family molecular chaperone regulator 2 [Papilio machaon]